MIIDGSPTCWCIGLTPKQRRVSELLVKGYTTKDIARSFGVSHRTIEDHRAAINKRLGVHSAVGITRKVFGIDP